MSEDPVATVLAYHQASSYVPGRPPAAPARLERAGEPLPFRRYRGAPLVRLAEIAPTPLPLWDDVWGAALPAAALERRFVAQLWFDSFAISAWQGEGASRHSLRVVPSAGNLHPTETYLVLGPAALADDAELGRPGARVFHYSAFDHGLARRVAIPAALWRELGLPAAAVLCGFTTIPWRSAWKYGERAWRLCALDAGHAAAALAVAAAVQGWRARPVALSDAALAALLGVAEQEGLEAELPVALWSLEPAGPPGEPLLVRFEERLAGRLGALEWFGRPTPVSREHRLWPALAAAARAARRPAPPGAIAPPAPPRPGVPLVPSAAAARAVIRGRRSRNDFDPAAKPLAAALFHRFLARMAAADPALAPLADEMAVALFVHRVEGVPAGFYFLPLAPESSRRFAGKMQPGFLWRRPDGCPPGLTLSLLAAGDGRRAAEALASGQPAAGRSLLTAVFLADLAPALDRHGAWAYRQLHAAAGARGHLLCLEAAAAGLSATGLSGFTDGLFPAVLGTAEIVPLYLVAVGRPVGEMAP